jgi:hypothetical protein
VRPVFRSKKFEPVRGNEPRAPPVNRRSPIYFQ